MSAFAYKKPAGDTLIEVIFAFAILATIIGFAYGGAVQAHKNAVAAEERTQALEVVRYQKEALTAYRNSLPWDNEGVGSTPNFIEGGGGNSSIDFTNNSYCLKKATPPTGSGQDELAQWQMQQISGEQNCNDLLPSLTFVNNNPIVQINFTPVSPIGCTGVDCDTISAEVSAKWLDPFNKEQSSKNTILLTRQR